MKIKPLNDRVLVLRIEEEEKTSGGIIIPDTAKEKPQEGKIIAAGPGKFDDSGKRIALDVKAGDRVEKGQVIALLGASGRTTGPHVHFEVRRDGKPVDPAGFISSDG